MKKFTPIFGAALLPLLAGVASAAQPVQLTDTQMDKVTAGWSLLETDVTNTSATAIAIYSGSLAPCAACYLDLNISGVLAIQSVMLVPVS